MSRKTILYIAMSLDGYIADKKGSVDWLSGHGEINEVDNSYSEFVKNIDTVIMGSKTYEQIVTELSPDVWVYDGMKSYVVTSNNIPNNDNVEFIKGDICAL